MKARRGHARTSCLLIALVVVLLAGPPAAPPSTAIASATTPAERVSVSSGGAQADGSSTHPSISADGRYVAFASRAANLVSGDTNRKQDVFVHDRQTGVTTRVSVSSTGAEGNGDSAAPAISADGRFVAFESKATNLVAGDTNRHQDVFVHDRQTGVTTRVSLSGTGAEGNGDSGAPAVSADGRFVAFASKATNLVAGDTNRRQDVFVRDQQTGTTLRVSVSGTGAEGNGDSGTPAISADGRFVAFESRATNLVADDTNRRQDVFVHDVQAGATTRVSVSTAGAQGDGDSGVPSISADGRFIAFESSATTLVPGDTNRKRDVFVHDTDTGATTRVSVSAAGAQGDGDSRAPSIDADGRFVVFLSKAATLVAGDLNRKQDVFVRDLDSGETTRVSDPEGVEEEDGNSDQPSVSADGNAVAFVSLASNLVPGDTNRRTDVFVVQRNRPPEALADEAATTQDTAVEIAVLGNDHDPDGDPLTLRGFTQGAHGTVSVTADVATYAPAPGFTGSDTFTYTIDDGRGGTASATVSITVSAAIPANQAPVVGAGAAQTTITLPASASLTGSASDDHLPNPPDTLTTTWSMVSGPGTVTFGDAAALDTTAAFSTDGTYVLRLSAFDGQLTTTADITITVNPAGGGGGLPPDPTTVAPTLSASVASTIGRSTEFLYTGSNPIQTGVAPGTIDPVRAGVLRGRVLDGSGAPLPGVTVTILNHAELGQTLSRADGMFDLAVNGGGPLTVRYEKQGLLPAQRQVDAPWQEFVVVPDVALVTLDPQVTAIDLTAGAMQAARGSAVTDGDGTRRATLLFAPGTTATMVMPDGSTQPLTTLNVRATEYTVGPNGRTAMPAELPPNSAYTYAVDFSTDEAIAAGAASVAFNQPVVAYLENFLGFPTGITVPAGYYDRARGVWVAANSGRVIRITGITGGVATVDTVGTQGLPALALSQDELRQLASLYSVGQTLWRTPIAHFSPWDFNWGFGPPPDAQPPRQLRIPLDPACDDCWEILKALLAGSIIDTGAQRLGEAVDVVGTPFALHYDSLRQRGRQDASTLPIALSGDSVPASLKRIDLEVQIAGRVFTSSFSSATRQTYRFAWDGVDAYGRQVNGRQHARVRIGYVYDGVYNQTNRFGYNGNGLVITGSRTRTELTIWQQYFDWIGPWDARGQGLGGWSLDVHHAYDPAGRVLYLGTGDRRDDQVAGPFIATVAGGCKTNCATAEGAPATQVSLANATHLAVDAVGNLFMLDTSGCRVRKVDPAGRITTVAGSRTGVCGFGGDNGPATSALLRNPYGLAVDGQGNLFIADTGNFRIRKVDAAGTITTIAGNGFANANAGVCDANEEGVLAVNAPLCDPVRAVAVDASGNVYFEDGLFHIRKVDPSGVLSTAVRDLAGVDHPATDTQGNLYFALGIYPYSSTTVVQRLSPDGTRTTIAGGGTLTAGDADGFPATQAKLNPLAIAADRQGNVYVSDGDTWRVRMVSPAGTLTTVAGTVQGGIVPPLPLGDGGPAAAAVIPALNVGLAVDSVGNLFVSCACVYPASSVRKISAALPGVSAGEIVIASQDGGELYVFNGSGRHGRTLHALTGAVLFQFAYDAGDRLIQVTDGDGNATTIERDGSGRPTAIVGPYGQRTGLTLDAHGYLASITNPAAQQRQFGYTSGGLLTAMTDPRGGAHAFTYDSLGRLTRDADPAAGFVALSRADDDTGYVVTSSTAENRTLTYEGHTRSTGAQERIARDAAGHEARLVKTVDATETTTEADGTVATTAFTGDPRWAMQAPAPRSATVTTPAGLSVASTFTRSVTLSDATNPFSLTAQTDTLKVNGLTSSTSYAAATRTFTATTPVGRHTTTTIDAQGRPTALQLADLSAATFTYDARGRLSTATRGTGADARTVTYTYDSGGYLASVADALSRTTSFVYDAAGRVTQKTLPDGRAIAFTYDAAGNITSVTPPGRPAHVFAFTPVDLTSSYTAPDIGAGNVTVYAYNTDRQLTTVTRPDSSTATFAYDSAGRLSTLTIPNGQYAYTYSDTTGNLATITATGNETLSYTYDGSLITGIAWSGAVTGTIGRAYDNFFRLVSESVDGGNTVTFQYDNDGLLTRAGALTVTRTAVNGLVSGTALGGVSETRTYNAFGEVTRETTSYSGSTLLDAQYTYDPLGRITQKTELIGGTTTTFAYTYDQAGRLAGVTLNNASAPSTTYTYDGNGNRLGATAGSVTTDGTYDAQDRLLTYGATAYTYTPDGELATKTTSGQVTHYDYDVLGNLRAVTLPDGTQIQYVIDGQHRRVGKMVNGTLVQGFLYEGLTIVAELDGASAVVSRFVYGTRANVPEYMTRQGVTYRIIADHLGSPRLVVNVGTGAIAQRLDYDEFGNVVADTNPGFQPFGFAGGLRDAATGLVRFGARDYDAEAGRWTAKDPLLFAGGASNLYGYVLNDPINATDVSGLQSVIAVTPGAEESIVTAHGFRNDRELVQGLDHKTNKTIEQLGDEILAALRGKTKSRQLLLKICFAGKTVNGKSVAQQLAEYLRKKTGLEWTIIATPGYVIPTDRSNPFWWVPALGQPFGQGYDAFHMTTYSPGTSAVPVDGQGGWNKFR